MILVVYIRVNLFSPSLVYLLDLVMRPSFMKVELRHTSQYATVYVDGVVPHSASKNIQEVNPSIRCDLQNDIA